MGRGGSRESSGFHLFYYRFRLPFVFNAYNKVLRVLFFKCLQIQTVSLRMSYYLIDSNTNDEEFHEQQCMNIIVLLGSCNYFSCSKFILKNCGNTYFYVIQPQLSDRNIFTNRSNDSRLLLRPLPIFFQETHTSNQVLVVFS